ncbi:MAG: hypothetical protein JWP12_3445 [Bacteroidetes bacterium]|nr:hypothetical protein [Bacteroidota bacterium]
MASGKESPRQKMIGMMYLVLTALLALNVSKDILDAFVVVNKGLENTNTNFSEHNDLLYSAFDLAKSVDPVKVKPNWEKAQQIKKQSTELVAYIDGLQKQMIVKSEGVSQSIADTLQMENINGKDSYDAVTNLMIGDSEDGSGGESLKLKNKLNDYRTLLTNYIEPADRKSIRIDIDTKDPEHSENNENWEMYNFFHRPIVASMTILSKMKNDVKNAEAATVDYLLKATDAMNLKFDTVAAKVIPQSNYVLLGEEYKADLFIAAFNKTKNPEITIDGNTSPIDVERGLGKYNVKTSKEGIVTYSGTIKMMSPQNKPMIFPFKSEYIVARPALTVSAEKMNVVYIGLDNPISVSVPGIPNEKLSVSINNGTLKPDGSGKYLLNVKDGAKTDITVSAIMENGERRSMGVMTFRVKRIPKPTAKIGDVVGDGSMSRDKLTTILGPIANYEDFVYEAHCKIISFDVSYPVKGIIVTDKIKGNIIPQSAKDAFGKLKRNDRVYFENIYAVGPDGLPVKINPMTVKIN